MSGETDLGVLLASVRPRLRPGVYVYCSVPGGQSFDGLDPVCVFREDEGVTLIVEKSDAEKFHLPIRFEAAWITLDVHSALDAVGFLAAVARALADVGVGCNAVAAYYHDHLFVPLADAERAVTALEALQRQACSSSDGR